MRWSHVFAFALGIVLTAGANEIGSALKSDSSPRSAQKAKMQAPPGGTIAQKVAANAKNKRPALATKRASAAKLAAAKGGKGKGGKMKTPNGPPQSAKRQAPKHKRTELAKQIKEGGDEADELRDQAGE
jgi:hypothetical protein